MSEKNTFVIYLKGGQSFEIRTKISYTKLAQIIFEGDERATFISFENPYCTLKKDDISAIKDVTKVRQLERDIVMCYDKTQPYKPWTEEK